MNLVALSSTYMETKKKKTIGHTDTESLTSNSSLYKFITLKSLYLSTGRVSQ